MEQIKLRSETLIKKKSRFSEIVQTIGLLAIGFSLVNWLFLSIISNWIILPSVIVYLVGTVMGAELTSIKEIDSNESAN